MSSVGGETAMATFHKILSFRRGAQSCHSRRNHVLRRSGARHGGGAQEASHILQHATARSLVIMDELGRPVARTRARAQRRRNILLPTEMTHSLRS